MVKRIRLGMIGSGQISDRFFEQASNLAGVDFVAVTSLHQAHADQKALQFGIPHAYDSIATMIDRESLDGVVVTTPHTVHAEPTLYALSQGLHVLVEKPMATSYEDAKAMVDQAQQHQRILMALPFDDYPEFTMARTWLDEQYLGKITGAEAQLSIPGPPRNNWYYDRRVAGGGAAFDCLVYPLSRLVTLLGPAIHVTAEMNTLIPHRLLGEAGLVESTVDDNVSLIPEFSGGQHAVIRTLWGIAFAQNNTIIYGREGTLALNDSGYPIVLHSPKHSVPHASPVEWRGLNHCYVPTSLPNWTPDMDILGRFIHSIRTGEPLSQGSDFSLHVMEIVQAVIESSTTGKRQYLTTTFQPEATLSHLMDTTSRPI